MSSAITFDPHNSEKVSVSLNSKNAGDISNDVAKPPAVEPVAVVRRKGSDLSDAETLDDISESSLLENEEFESNTSKTYQIKSAPEISPLKQAVKGFVLNKLSKKVASSQLLSGLTVKLVKRLEEGRESSLANSNVVLEVPNNPLPIPKEAEVSADSVSQELKSVVANRPLLIEPSSVEEALECFEESKSSSSDSLGIVHLKVEKKKLSRSLPSSPARHFGRRSSAGYDRFSVLEEGSDYYPANQLMQDLFVKASTLSEEAEIELDDQGMSSEEHEASLSERFKPIPHNYPENAFVLSGGDGSKHPVESSTNKASIAFKFMQDFLSLPLSHLLLLASIVLHNTPYLSSYYITLIFDAFVVAYICQKLVFQSETLDLAVPPSVHDTRLERATMTFELNNKTISGSVKILRGKFENDESIQSALLVHARVEDHQLKIFPFTTPEERNLNIDKPIDTFNLRGATVSLVPKGLLRKRAFRKRYPICITLPRTVKNSLHSKDDLDIEDTEFSPGIEELVEAKKETALYLYALSDREKEALFYALLQNTKSCDKNSLENSVPQPSCSTVTSSMSYSSLLDSQSDESLSITEERIGKTKITEIKISPIISPLPFENYAESLLKNYERETQEQYQRIGYFPSSMNDMERGSCSTEWLNVVLGRLFYDFLTQKKWSDYVITRIQKKLDVIELPTFVESLKITETAMGDSVPQLHSVSDPTVDKLGIWFDFDFVYTGSFQMTLKAKTKMPSGVNQESNDSAESKQNMENSDTHDEDGSGSSKSQSPTQSKLLNKIEKWVSHKHFQTVAQSRFVKKYVGDLSNMNLTLAVEVKKLQGIMTFNIPPVPSDRIWYGFRNDPDLSLHAFPKVGTREINLSSVVQMIERKLIQAFKKALVLPNMDDLVIPIMFSPIYDQ